MGIIRAEVIARMHKAFQEGVSASRFIKDMRSAGLSYRRSDMLADWRDVNEIEIKDGLARYVRKGYVPSERVAELKEWALSREYMYKVRTESILRPGEAPVSRFVNIMADSPLTIEEIEREAWERSFVQSPPGPAEERHFIVETAIHRAES